jgi:hypothetical protein
MATSAGTEPSDVEVEIDTVLDDSKISSLLDRVEREIDRQYDEADIKFDDTQHRVDFEAALTALRIAEGWDRRAESEQSGGTSTTYETAEIDNLRKRVRRLDPGEEFGRSGRVVRDDGRHISTTGSGS